MDGWVHRQRPLAPEASKRAASALMQLEAWPSWMAGGAVVFAETVGRPEAVHGHRRPPIILGAPVVERWHVDGYGRAPPSLRRDHPPPCWAIPRLGAGGSRVRWASASLDGPCRSRGRRGSRRPLEASWRPSPARAPLALRRASPDGAVVGRPLVCGTDQDRKSGSTAECTQARRRDRILARATRRGTQRPPGRPRSLARLARGHPAPWARAGVVRSTRTRSPRSGQAGAGPSPRLRPPPQAAAR